MRRGAPALRGLYSEPRLGMFGHLGALGANREGRRRAERRDRLSLLRVIISRNVARTHTHHEAGSCGSERIGRIGRLPRLSRTERVRTRPGLCGALARLAGSGYEKRIMCAACAGAGNAKRERKRERERGESADEQLAACPCVYANVWGKEAGGQRGTFALARGVREPPPAVSVSYTTDRVRAGDACICSRGKSVDARVCRLRMRPRADERTRGIRGCRWW